MTVAPETVNFAATLQIVRRELLAEANERGYFEGRLSSSALATATAVSALSLFDRHASDAGEEVRRLKLAGRSLVERAIPWLLAEQNRDGGWGDCPDAKSNVSTAMLVRSAFESAGKADEHRAAMDRAETFVRERGARRRVRSRGSLRSLRLSPTSVMPRTTRTMAMPCGMAVHQMPLVTSETARLRS